MKRLLWMVPLLTFLPACASLTVDVDVYDGPKASTPSRVQLRAFAEATLENEVLHPGPDHLAFERFLARAERSVLAENAETYFEAGINRRQAQTMAHADWADPGQIKDVFESQWESLASSRARTREAAENLHTEATFKTVGELEKIFQQLSRELRELSAGLDFFSEVVANNEELAVRIRADVDELLRPDAGIATGVATNGRIVGHPLFDPNIAHLSRRDKHWKDFGHLRKNADLGSSQFVVVQEGLVVFRPKSLDFDPTPVIGAATAVTRLGLEVAATMASGRFASLSNPDNPDCSDDDSCDEKLKIQKLVDEGKLESQRLTLEQRSAAQRDFLLRLADLSERTAAQGAADEATIKGLRSELQAAIGRYSAKSGGGKEPAEPEPEEEDPEEEDPEESEEPTETEDPEAQ